MMGAKREEKDDREWNADQPEQDGTHDSLLPPNSRSAWKMVRNWNGSEVEPPAVGKR
jgi:hypothetical protein